MRTDQKRHFVTATEAYELTTQGGATDFARVVAACEASGNWCLIGGMAVNTYVEPVYTLDAGLVVIATGLSGLADRLREQGFVIEEHEHSLNGRVPAASFESSSLPIPDISRFRRGRWRL